MRLTRALLGTLPIALALALVVACSSSTSSAPSNDAGTDAGDSGTKLKDSSAGDASDAATGPACYGDQPANFDCAAPTAKAGQTVCDDTAIAALVSCFGSSGNAIACNAAKTQYPACAQCMTQDWLYTPAGASFGSPDTGACMLAVDPTSTCGKAARCEADCYQAVCGGCSLVPGSGQNGASDTDYYDCSVASSTDPSACLNVNGYVTCANTAALKPCVIFADVDFTTFFRGACRDGGNWTNATSPTDGGADSAD